MAENRDIGTDAKTIDQYTILTGDRAKLKDLLCNRLTECGWREDVRLMCRQMMKERGVTNTNVEELIAEVTPQARSMVPEEIKREMLLKIREILAGSRQAE